MHPGDRLASIRCDEPTTGRGPRRGGVVLLPLDVGLHIGWRPQSHRMPNAWSSRDQ